MQQTLILLQRPFRTCKSGSTPSLVMHACAGAREHLFSLRRLFQFIFLC